MGASYYTKYNGRSITRCQVWITDIVRLGGREMSIFDEAARCAWSQRDGDEKFNLTIRSGVPQRANLFMFTKQEHPPVPHPQLDFVKIILNAEIQAPGFYRVFIIVTAKDMPPVRTTLIFEWADFDHISLNEEVPTSVCAAPDDAPARP
jgi:hypothetical protein